MQQTETMPEAISSAPLIPREVNVDHQEQPERHRHIGNFLVRSANFLTDVRRYTAPILGVAIAMTDENVPTTAALLASEATDAVDGTLARAGAKALNVPTKPDNALRDSEADKALAYSAMAGLAARYMRQRRFGSATLIATNLWATRRRDKVMAEHRAKIGINALDPDLVKAIPINKAKTGLQFASLNVLASPAAESTKHRLRALALLTSSTVVGHIGQKLYSREIERAMMLHNRTAMPENWPTVPIEPPQQVG